MKCKECLRRMEELNVRGKKARDFYEVGNPAKNDMGHEMYFTKDGIIALCVARRKDK